MSEELDLTELIKLANSKEGNMDNSTRKHPGVLKYIRKKGIKQGDIRVPVYVIMFDFITKWEGVGYYDKCSYIELGRTFSQLFEKGRSGNFRYYYLNDVYDLSFKAKKKAREYYKKWQLTTKRNQRKRQDALKQSSQDSTQDSTLELGKTT